MAINFLNSQSITGTLTVSSIANASSDTDKFLVSDSGIVKYRTGAQVRSDIGAGTGDGSVTSVTVQGTTGLSGSGTVTSSGTITLTNADRGSAQNIFKNVASDSGTAVADNNDDTLTIIGAGSVTTAVSGDTLTITGTDTNDNYYVSSVGFATGTGILSLYRHNTTTLTVDLDGRYLELGGGTMTGNIVLDDGAGASPNIQFVNASDDDWYIYNDSNGKFQVQQNSTIRATFSSGDLELTNDLVVSGGGVSLLGTGRIQGVDTVSAGTDATNKTYVDNAVAGAGSGTYLPLAGGTMTGNITMTNGVNILGTELKIDCSQDITLDAGGGDIILSDDGTDFGTISSSSGTALQIRSRINNADMFLRGVDGGTEFTALRLDMSASGTATFSSDVLVSTGIVKISSDGANWATLTESGSGDFTIATIDDLRLESGGEDIVLRGSSSTEFGRLTNNSGNFNITGADIAIDASGDITLDAAGNDIRFMKNAVEYGKFKQDSNNFDIYASVENKDIRFKGNDSGSTITALYLDMSAAGSAYFNHNIGLNIDGEIDWDGGAVKLVGTADNIKLQGGSLSITADGSNATVLSESGSGDFEINTVADMVLDAGGGDILLRDDGSGFGQLSNNGQDFEIRAATNDKDILFKGYDNGSLIQALRLDMSDAGWAHFNAGIVTASSVTVGNDLTVAGGDITLSGTGRIQGIDTVSAGTDAASKTYVDNAVSGSGSGTFLPLAGGTMTGDVIYNDNVKIKLGTGGGNSDIYHDGTDMLIRQHTSAGDMSFAADSTGSGGSSTTYFALDGGVVLTRFYKGANFNDNVKLTFGDVSTPGDLEIYHDGSNSFIRETGTGNFYLRASDSLYVQRTSDGLEMAQFTGGGGSFLYFNGSLKFGTTNTGIDVTGEVKGDSLDIDGNADISGDVNMTDGEMLMWGGNSILTHSGSATTIGDNSSGSVISIASGNSTFAGNIYMSGAGHIGAADNFYVGGATAGTDHTYIGDNNRNVTIYNGATFTVASGNTTLGGNLEVQGADVTITANIIHSSDSNTYFGFNAADTWRVVTGGSQRLEVNNSGVKIGSGARVTTILDEDDMASDSATALATQQSIKAYVDSSVTGVLIYQGTWNASTNSPTLSSGSGTPGYYYIVSVAGSTNLDGITDWQVGDWAVFSDQATDAWQKIDNTAVGNVSGSGGANYVTKWTGSGTIANSSIIDQSGTVTFSGDVVFDSTHDLMWDSSESRLEFWDNAKLSFGDPGGTPDLVLYHDGSNSYINDEGTGSLLFQSGGSTRFSIGGDVGVIGSTDFFIPQGRKLLLDGVGGHTYIEEESDSNLKFYVAGSEQLNITNTSATFTGIISNGQFESGSTAVTLKNAGNTKLATTGGGVDITGALAVGNINMTGILDISATYPRINLNDTNHEDDWSIINDDGSFKIYNVDDAVDSLKIDASNNTTFAGNISIPSGYVGRDGHNYISFSTDNNIIIRVADTHRLKLTSAGLLPYADSSYDLGSTALRYTNLWVDNINGSTPVTGGPFLPLAGGTMTGAITMPNNTAVTWSTGSIRVESSVLKLVGNSGIQLQDATQIYYDGGAGAGVATGAAVGLDIHNSGTATNDDAKVTFETQGQLDWIAGIDRSATAFKISRSDAFGTNDVLTLDNSSDALFASDVAVTAKLGVGVTAVHASYDLYNQGTAYFNGAVTVDDAFTQSGGADSTFSGDVNISGGDVNISGASTPKLTITDTTNSLVGRFRVGNTAVYLDADSGEGVASTVMNFQTDGSTKLQLSTGTSRFLTNNLAIRRDDTTPVLIFERNDTSIVSGNDLGQFQFKGADPSGYNEGARMSVEADGTWDTNVYPSRIKFEVKATDTLQTVLTLDKDTHATFTGDILTNTDSSSDIGKTGTRWANIWVDNINGAAPAVGSNYLPLSGGTMTGDARWIDSEKVELGTSGDLQIQHNGSSSYIQNYTGDLIIQNAADDARVRFQCDNGSGSTATYFDLQGSQATASRLYTNWYDNSVITCGNGLDLQIYHDATDSIIYNQGGDLYFKQATDDKDIIFQNDDGSGGMTAYMTLDGSAENINIAKNTIHPDSIYTYWGDANDFYIGHDSTNTNLINSTGHLYISNYADDKQIIFQNDDGSGGVETYFYLDGLGGGSAPFTVFPDAAVLAMGSNHDTYIQHTGAHMKIDNYTGNFEISNQADDGDLSLRCDNGSGGSMTYIKLDGGIATTLVYTDLLMVNDGTNGKLKFGASQDLQIYHDGSHSYIEDSGTGNLQILATNLQINNSGNTQNMITASDGGAVTLYTAGNAKLATTSVGVTVSGTRSIFAADTVVNSFSGTAAVEVYANASDSVLMVHQDDGNHESKLHFRTGGNDTQIIVPASGNALQINTETVSSALTMANTTGDVTFAGRIIAPVGSKASPAITFTGDLDTGIYREGANDLAISVGGSAALLANSTGIGIPEYIYHVGDITTKIGFSAADTFVVRTADTERFSVNNSGFAGASGARVTSILDEDNMASNSATALATQQSIKAYVDANAGGTINNSTINLTAGAGLTGSSSFTLNQASNQTITFSLDIVGLTTTTSASEADWFAVSNTMGTDYKIAPGNINLSTFNNDSGWTSNAGTITGSGSAGQIAFFSGSSTALGGDAGLTYNGNANKLIFNGDYAIRENGGTFVLNEDDSDVITKISCFGGNGSMTFNENSIYTAASGFYVPSGYGISVGTSSTASNTLRCTGNIIAYYSDERLKDFEGTIPNALDKVCQLNGYYYKQNKKATELGFDNEERQVGVSAQEVEKIMPEVIEKAPISDNIEEDYLTVDYGKLVPLLIESIKELKKEIEILKNK